MGGAASPELGHRLMVGAATHFSDVFVGFEFLIAWHKPFGVFARKLTTSSGFFVEVRKVLRSSLCLQ
jgi:hypothetical protein